MQLVAGVVQLLIFQHLVLLLARAKPLNDVSSLYTDANKCNGNIAAIMSQIHSLIMDMNLKDEELFITYAQCQNFSSTVTKNLCRAKDIEFPAFGLNSNSSEEDKLSGLFKTFHYMNTAIGNITQEQVDLNPQKKILHEQLNASKTEIAAVISNLSCVLSKRYTLPKVDIYYTVSLKNILKKANGCRVLENFKHFLKKAKKITSDWEKKGEYTQDPSSDSPPDHR